MSQSHAAAVASSTDQKDPKSPSSGSRSPPSSSDRSLRPQASLSESVLQLRDSPSLADSATSFPSRSAHGANGRETGDNKNHPSSSRSHQSNIARFPPAIADSSMSAEDFARSSPKDRLNALLSSNKPASPSVSSARSTPSPSQPHKSHDKGTKPYDSNTSHAAQSRNVSSSHPTHSAVQMNEKTARTLDNGQSATGLRNVSLDSSSSATSSPAVPPTSNMTDSRSPTPSDAASYIAANGSTAAALEKVLVEKQTLSNRNDQLWKLVEKQRSMILGLHKDLERSMQEKEKYRKRVKEMMALSPSVPEAPAIRSPISASSAGPSGPSISAHASKLSDASDLTVGPKSPTFLPGSSDPQALAGKLPKSSGSTKSIKLQDAPLKVARANASSEQSSSTVRSTKVSHAQTDSSKPSVISPKTPTATILSQTTSPVSSPAMSSPGEKARKAVPKPLDLSNARPQPQHQAQASQTTVEDDSGSDYESVLDEVKRSPIDRGRRRTREDDDRAREQLAIEEEERRSASAKEGKRAEVVLPPVPVSQPAVVPAGMQAATGLPASPRGPMLGALQSPLQANMGSIASTLSNAPIHQSVVQVQKQETAQLATKSPGLPMSPRPSDRPMNAAVPRVPAQSIASPGPLSPKSGMLFSPRPPRGTIPLPGLTPNPQTVGGGNTLDPSPTIRSPQLTEVYRGFVTEQYPNLLLPPNALPYITVNVYSSRLRPSRQSLIMQKGFEDDPGFLLAVNSRSDRLQLWRVEKTVSAFTVLDRALRTSAGSEIPALNRSLFNGHSPAQIDARRNALNQYFDVILDSHLSETAAFQVCEFLSLDVLPPQVDQELGRASIDNEPVASPPTTKRRKEGYLSKKGKQFGGWKARYFIIEGTELRYYEAPGGQPLGYVKLHKAHVARQIEKESDPDGEFRHAFVVLEPKRRDSTALVQHILCAESDEERDGWVDAIQQCIGGDPKLSKVEPTNTQATSHHQHAASGSTDTSSRLRPIQTVSYEATAPAQAPVMVGSDDRSHSPPSPEQPLTDSPTQPANHLNISGPVSGGPIQNATAWGNKASPSHSKDPKKRNMFGFKSKSSDETSPRIPPSPNPVNEHLNQHLARRQAPVRPVFGMSIAEAAEHCPPFGIDLLLPAPVYRCIEYLQARNAAKEEGIFRLSGSNTLIKALKERFNSEGDVKLLDGNYYDIHAVASLLKLYLRELPESVLTRELHIEFLKVLELDDKLTKINAVNVLSHRLPDANFELLKTMSHFLNEIVSNSDVNKMTVRNVGIVFSPTLNIPAPLISLFLTDYTSIFLKAVDQSASPVSEASPATPLSYDDFRSPRKQMFTDVSSPSYNQTSFAGFQPVHSTSFQGQDPRLQYDTGFVPAQHSQVQPQSATFHNAPSVTQVADTGGFSSLNAFLAPANAPAPAPTPSPGPTPGYGQGPPSLSSSPGSGVSVLVENRRSKRESSNVLGHTPSTGSNSSINGTSYHSHHTPGRGSGGGSLDGKRKGSSQRLREVTMSNSGMADLREE